MTNLHMIKTFAAVLVAATVGAAVPSVASASEHCKGVYIEAINKTGGKIKIVDIDYNDTGKWRSEPTKNRTLNKNQRWSWNKRLERVNNESTQVRIEYRTYIGKAFNKWSRIKRATSAPQICRKNAAFAVTLK